MNKEKLLNCIVNNAYRKRLVVPLVGFPCINLVNRIIFTYKIF